MVNTTTVSQRKPLVFIVDDDMVATRIIERTLLRSGIKSEVAHDVAAALNGIRQHPPDLILLDVSLPDGTGLDMCRQLQAEPGLSQIPVIFISAHEDVATKLKAFDAGAVDYIAKPLAAAEVLARVRTHLRLKRAYESLAQLQAQRIQNLAMAQKAIMPQPEDVPGARFEVAMRQVLKAGGDFYDVVPAGENVVDYIVADASGHDLAASIWTAALKTLLSEHSQSINTPRDVLQFINSSLLRIVPEGVFFTLVHARLNRASRELSLISAGHPPAILVPQGGGTMQVVRQSGDVLGAFSEVFFHCTVLPVIPGDRIFLYTDGLVEMQNDTEAGRANLLELLMQYRSEPLDRVVNRVVGDLCFGGPCRDDVVLMGIEV
jgi:phosphoserine phosphatase RsbU/P